MKNNVASHRLTLLLAGLAMLGPFSIDTYLPSFHAIAVSLRVDEVLVQQTLSVYLLAFSTMMLFHGTLSDTFGRRRIVLIALAVYIGASLAAVWSPNLHWLLVCRALQGMSAGAGVVIGRAIVRDLLAGADAQRAMAQITMVFGLAPAIAPIIGGWLQRVFDWPSVFAFLSAFGLLLWLSSYLGLPESLPPEARQPLHLRTIAGNYCRVLRSGRFLLMALAIGTGFAGFGLYIASAPYFVMTLLGLPETAFGWLFVPMVTGMITGAWVASRNAHRVVPGRMIRNGYLFMAAAVAANLLYNALLPPALPWMVLPLMLYNFGLSLLMPSLTLRIVDLFPALRGLASSLLSFVQTAVFGATAAIAPLFFGSGLRLAAGMAGAFLLSVSCYRATRMRAGAA